MGEWTHRHFLLNSEVVLFPDEVLLDVSARHNRLVREKLSKRRVLHHIECLRFFVVEVAHCFVEIEEPKNQVLVGYQLVDLQHLSKPAVNFEYLL